MQRGENMRQEEKKGQNWEAAEEKPPIIQSGHLENRKRNEKGSG